jgi:hypothetical protein
MARLKRAAESKGTSRFSLYQGDPAVPRGSGLRRGVVRHGQALLTKKIFHS